VRSLFTCSFYKPFSSLTLFVHCLLRSHSLRSVFTLLPHSLHSLSSLTHLTHPLSSLTLFTHSLHLLRSLALVTHSLHSLSSLTLQDTHPMFPTHPRSLSSRPLQQHKRLTLSWSWLGFAPTTAQAMVALRMKETTAVQVCACGCLYRLQDCSERRVIRVKQ
jgi:hypothetical protein